MPVNNSVAYPSLAEMADAEKVVEKDLKAVNKALNVLKQHHKKMTLPKINAKLGTFLLPTYSMNMKYQRNLLQALPIEIQRMVWKNLYHQPDRTALAVTCKWNAMMYMSQRFEYSKIAIKKPLKEHHLAVLLRLDSWMPGGRRLCFECVRFRSRQNPDDWTGDSAYVHESSVRAGRVKKDAMIRGPRCPRCSHQNAVAKIENKQFVKEYKKVLKTYIGPLQQS